MKTAKSPRHNPQGQPATPLRFQSGAGQTPTVATALTGQQSTETRSKTQTQASRVDSNTSSKAAKNPDEPIRIGARLFLLILYCMKSTGSRYHTLIKSTLGCVDNPSSSHRHHDRHTARPMPVRPGHAQVSPLPALAALRAPPPPMPTHPSCQSVAPTALPPSNPARIIYRLHRPLAGH